MIASLSHICTVNVFILVFEHVLSPLNYSITLQCRKQLRPIQPEIIKRRLIHDLYERSSLPTTTQQYGLARSRWDLAITLFLSLCAILPAHHKATAWTGQIKVSFGDHWVLWPCSILPPQNKTAVWAWLRSKYNNVIWLDPGTGTGRQSLKALFPFHKAGWRSLWVVILSPQHTQYPARFVLAIIFLTIPPLNNID